MKVFLTGGTGFVGGEVARQLRGRGDEVVALVRTRSKATSLIELGCSLVEGDLNAVDAIREAVEGCDGVVHSAGMYEVGIPRAERPRMFDANVRGAERVLDAAIDAGVSHILHVSTIGVFGNTRGGVHPGSPTPERRDFLSVYDETKYLAHRLAERHAESGAPVTIAAPGAVYGPGDHSEVGNQLDQLRAGKLRFVAFPETGFNAVHVEDAAGGILRVLDRGEVGATYPLGGEITTLGDILGTAARILGRKLPPRIPAALIKASIPFGRLIGPVIGAPPNLREVVRAADGVTYWASDARARDDLGYAPRDLETGLRETLTAAP
ncbi:MAG TPA: NAD-dependent epimerase/dehydratase family protein [Actinomycetota bacterium]